MRRRKRTEVRQEEIAHAVLELIASEGHQALSMVAVAKRIGVVPSALYRHYPCKEDMILAAMQLHRDERLRDMKELLDSSPSVLQAYISASFHIPTILRQTSAMPRITFGLLPVASERLRRGIQDLFEDMTLQITQGFERAQAEGEIDPSVDCRTAALGMWSLFATAMIRVGIHGPDFDVKNHLLSGWRFFLRAVLPPGADLAPYEAILLTLEQESFE